MNRRSVLSLGARRMGGLGLLLAAAPLMVRAMAFTDAEAASALRAVLDHGARVAVGTLGLTDGFLSNDKVRIGLPDALEKAAPVLRTVGQGRLLDELTTAMNHAAEKAVAQALPLLTQAIKTLALPDAPKTLQGGDNAVSGYFSDKARGPLALQFRPVVGKVLAGTDLVERYKVVTAKAGELGLLPGLPVTVQEHLTQKALDGIFFVVGEEERRIRKAPAATGNTLIKKVFGAL
jgi:hypothetical protein